MKNMKKIYKIAKSNGTKNEFELPSYIKSQYSSLEDANVDFETLLKETKREYNTVSELIDKENWDECFKPQQSEIFWMEILKFEVDEFGNEEETDFGINKTEDFYFV